MPSTDEEKQRRQIIVMNILERAAFNLRESGEAAAIDVVWLLAKYMQENEWISEGPGIYKKGVRPPGWGLKKIAELAIKNGWHPPPDFNPNRPFRKS